MAIKGSLNEASLPDVLQLLAMGKKSGCLSVTHRQNFGYIFFDKGRICYASIVNRRDRLGDILVKNGLITQAQLEQCVSVQNRQRDKRLGEILVERNFIAREELHRYIRIQIEEAVYYLFTHGTRERSTSRRMSRPTSRTSSSPSIRNHCCSRARGASTSGV